MIDDGMDDHYRLDMNFSNSRKVHSLLEGGRSFLKGVTCFEIFHPECFDELAVIDNSGVFLERTRKKIVTITTRIEGSLITTKYLYFEEPIVDFYIDSYGFFMECSYNFIRSIHISSLV